MIRALLALVMLVLPLLHGPAQAASFAEKNLAQLVTEAEQIFVGSVSSLQSRRHAAGSIVTDVGFSDLRPVKGDSADMVLLVLGGEVDGVRLEIPGLPQFQPDTRYLVFSSGNGKDMFPVVGGPAGLFRIMAGSADASSIVLTASGLPLAPEFAAQVLAGASAPAQGPSQPAVTLELFLAAIKARLGRQ